MDNILSLLGLALRAGRLAAGEEPVGAACHAHKAYLVLLASDAADNSVRRAVHFCAAGNGICLTAPLTKEELGSCLGRKTCAMLAITDVGLAASVAEKLAQTDPEAYGEARDTLVQKAARAKRRRDEKRAQDKKRLRGGAPRRKEKRKQNTGR